MASSNIEAEMESVASYLKSASIAVTRDWLSGCIQYFHAENSNCTIAETKEFVIKQWELSDLRESSSGCLPNNMKSLKKITLRQKYALQVESIMNISSSAFSQLQKIRKADTENVVATEKKPEAWEPKPGRMLKMKLCDGVQVVEALEYQPLHMINENITPGTKVIIIGPVDCRRGIFFLKPANVKVIGGEVDSLLIVNHLENVLARTLNLPENDDPLATQTPETRVLPSITSANDNSNRTATLNRVESQPERTINSHPNCDKVQQSNFTSNSFNGREQEVCSEIDDLDISTWEPDDLFSEVNEEVPTPRQQNTVAHQRIHFDNTKTNSKITHTNRTGFKENTMSEIKIANTNTGQPRTNRDDARISNVSNSILASDEYVDSMLMDEWDDEEMINNEMFNAASSIGELNSSVVPPKKLVNNTALHRTNSIQTKLPFNLHQPPSHTSKHLPEASKKVGQAQPRKGSISNWLKKSSDLGPLSSSPSQTLVNKFATSSIRSSECSSKNSESTAKSNHLFNPALSTKRPKPQSDSNANKKIKEAENVHSKPTISNNYLDNMCNKSKTFADEEDWAEAYVNKQSFSFLNNSNASGDMKIDLTESPLKLSEEPSANDSIKKNYGKGEVSLFNNIRKGVNIPNKMKTAQHESISSHHQPQYHLPAAVCSPSDINSDMDVHLVNTDEMAIDDSVFPEASVSSSKHVRKSSNTSLDLTMNTRSGKDPEILQSFPILSPEPFEYLLHILHPSTKINGVHKVKGTILSLLTQLKVDANLGWHLSAKICDGTGTLDVDFTSEVLEGVIGLSHTEFKQMKREAAKNPLVKENLLKLLQDTRQKMIDLNCIFTVKFEQGKMASVINISDVTKQDVNKMKLRLSNISC